MADDVCGGRVELPGVAGTAVFKVFEMQVARTGLSLAEARAAGFDPVGADPLPVAGARHLPGARPLYVAMVGDRAAAVCSARR